MAKRNLCENCKHFHSRMPENIWGQCRRYPPQFDPREQWPAVGPEQWCGEHQPDRQQRSSKE